MKRLFCSVLILVLLVAVAALPVFAVEYSGTYTWDFTNAYVNKKIPNNNSPVTVSCSPVYNPTVTTTITMPSGCTGRVMAAIYYHNEEVRNSNSNTKVNDIVTCSANLRHNTEATQTYHFAYRNFNGIPSNWEYYFTSSNHNS